MSCGGGRSKAALKAELRIYKKENVDLRTQLLSNFGALHTSQSKLDEAQTRVELLKEQNDKFHQENMATQKTLRQLMRDVRKYKSRYNRENSKAKTLENELEKLLSPRKHDFVKASKTHESNEGTQKIKIQKLSELSSDDSETEESSS